MQQLTDKTFRKIQIFRWIIWGALVISYITVHFHRQSMGVVRDDLVRDFGLSSSSFANIGSMYFYVYMLMQIPSGILADSLGPRKTVAAGTLLSGLGSVVFGLSPSVPWLYIGRLLIGLGVSVIFIAILKIQAQWFKESEFGTMSGLTSFFGNLGGVFAQTPLSLMIAVFSWRMSFAMIGAFTVFIAILCYVLVRNTPQEMGFPPVNETAPGLKENETSISEILRTLGVVLKNPGTWVAFWVFAGFHGALISLGSVWGISYLVDVYGFSEVSAANNIAVFIIGIAIGGIIVGKISDYTGYRKRTILVVGSLNVLCWVILLIVFSGKPPLIILTPLLFILGLTMNSLVLCWAYGKEVNPPKMSGISTSVVNVGGFVGGALLPPLLGVILDTYGGILPPVELYQKAFMCCLAASLFSLALSLLFKETHCKNIYAQDEPQG